MTNKERLQSAKDQAAREFGFDDILDANVSVQDDIEYDKIINRALELYGDAQWNAAIEKAAEEAEAIEGWNTGFSGNAASVDKQSILKLKKP